MRNAAGRLRVVHVIPYFYPAHVYGGPIQSVFHLCRALSRAGCEVRVLTTDINGPARLEVPNDREIELDDGVRVRYCHRNALESVSSQLLRRLPEYVRWSDVVHLAPVYSFPTMPTLLIARMMRRPLVWSPRGSLQRWERTRKVGLKALWERICRVLAPNAAVLHVTSEEEEQASVLRIPLRARVIPNAVELPMSIRRVPREDCLRLLFIGRLNPQKGIENLLEGCSVARSSGMKLSLNIVGAGEKSYTEKLQDRITGLKLNDVVHMSGYLVGEDKKECFEKSDVLVLPSFKENFGIVIAEALAHGVPVIASKGTPWAQVEANGCGMWVENDRDSLAKAIQAISCMPLAGMGKKGRDWMAREFSWDSIAAQMIEVYRGISGI